MCQISQLSGCREECGAVLRLPDGFGKVRGKTCTVLIEPVGHGRWWQFSTGSMAIHYAATAQCPVLMAEHELPASCIHGICEQPLVVQMTASVLQGDQQVGSASTCRCKFMPACKRRDSPV